MVQCEQQWILISTFAKTILGTFWGYFLMLQYLWIRLLGLQETSFQFTRGLWYMALCNFAVTYWMDCETHMCEYQKRYSRG